MKKTILFLACLLFATPNYLVKNFENTYSIKAGGGFTVHELINEKNDPVNPGFSVAYAVLKPNSTTKPHYLKSSNQVLYVIKGGGVMFIEGKKIKLKEKMSIYIAPQVSFYVKSSKNGLEFLSIVSPPWKAGDEVVKK
ncbi:cupin domain-containing protein [Nautilia sp.]